MLDTNAHRPVLLFLHIERSAGTAVHRFLAAHLSGYYVARPWVPIFSNEPEFGMGTREFRALLRTPGLHGLGGHTLRPWLVASVPCYPSWMTILRFPLDRYLSHFQYQRESARCAWSLEDFARDRRTWDWQVVRLAGYRSTEEAWRRLQAFDAVGFDEGLGRFMEALVQHYGLPLLTSLGRTNAVRSRVEWADLGSRERRLVEAANTRDLELWERARAQWGEWHLGDSAAKLLREARPTRARRLFHLKQRIWSTLVEIPAHVRYGDFPDPARFPLVACRSTDLWADESAPESG
ncbi:MAG: hypothetical protein GEU99_00870 [Luteitalea sp.]|nr:hypothetical protein [Luteitalea sp.]